MSEQSLEQAREKAFQQIRRFIKLRSPPLRIRQCRQARLYPIRKLDGLSEIVRAACQNGEIDANLSKDELARLARLKSKKAK